MKRIRRTIEQITEDEKKIVKLSPKEVDILEHLLIAEMIRMPGDIRRLVDLTYTKDQLDRLCMKIA